MSIAISASTMLVHIDNPTQSLNLYQIRKREKNISLPVTPTVEQLNKLGYHVVQIPPKPIADVVTQGPIVFEDGVYKQTWDTRDFNTEELNNQLESAKQNTLTEVNRYITAMLSIGIEYEFPDGEIGRIQVRDGDRANLTSLRIEAENAIRDEDTTFVRYFRAYEDTTHPLTASEIVAMTNAASAGYQSLLAQVWELKDLIKMSETIEDLPNVPTAPGVAE